MRHAHSKIERRPFECRVRFTGRLRDAKLVAAEISTPLSPPPSPVTPLAHLPASPPVAPPGPTAMPTITLPMDFWASDEGRELKIDRERIEAVLGQVQTSIAELRENQQARLGEMRTVAVELAMTMATRLMHDQVLSGEFPMEAKVRDMIDQLGEDTAVSVRLNPADLELLKSRLGGKPLLLEGDDPKLLPDATLGRGECRVEGRESMLLSEVSRELQEIRDELLRSLGHARS